MGQSDGEDFRKRPRPRQGKLFSAAPDLKLDGGLGGEIDGLFTDGYPGRVETLKTLRWSLPSHDRGSSK